MSEIKDSVREIANVIKKNTALEGAMIEPKDGVDPYEIALPEGITMDHVHKVYGYTEDFIAGQSLATGEIGEAAMKKDKKLESVSSELSIGSGRHRHAVLSVNYARSTTGAKSPTDKTPVTRFGVTTARIKTTAADASRGELKKVRTYLSDNAAKLFG